ncbi:uncharacterized protein LOC110454183 isoform X2 [Mizuhopecten yessoensis]|uniref:cAMP-dependent protein kinase regulatory subunit n=1 Tax=Mizuhopecten yessoensis TaxID=6573 RepID=A0A210QFT6_MIZYE|nr:uncharacterized protein LOC110454183 isoform X2 [Mizuhopecten yessoensis]OWF47569.1 cAMP-dependent protein kinase regulatory subunit [Mizuhopecten yessoensis]
MGNKDSRLTTVVDENDEEDGTDIQEEDSNIDREEKSINEIPFKTETQELSPLMVQKIRRCLCSLPLAKPVLTDQVLENLTSQVVVREYESGQDVVCKGLRSCGIYVIEKGRAEVMTSTGEVMADLFEGDYFGEVSVLYDVPCTARVRTKGKCRLLLLDGKVSQKLFGKVKVKMDMIDWFVAKRYIPPDSSNIDHDRIVRRMVFTYLRKVPVFADWSDSALRSLVLEIKPALIILYPPSSVVALHGDPPVSINVIIRGRAALTDQDCLTLAEVDAQTDPFVIGEESVLLGVNNEVTVLTTTCCEVIPIRKEWVQNVVSQHPQEAGTAWSLMQAKWMVHVNKDSRIHSKYPAYLQFEVIFQLMKQSSVFRQCSDRCVYDICLNGVPQEYYPGELVYTTDEFDQHVYVLVLMGDVELETEPESSWEYTLSAGETFCRCDWMENNGQLEALGQCLVVKLTYDDVLQAVTSNPDSVLTYPSEPESYVP